MNVNNKDIKPFYIYTDKNSLYIKNINEHTEKLCNNIHTYSANIDNSKKIHICCVDTSGKLIHLSNTNGYWKKNVIGKAFNNIKNIKNLRTYILNNYLNIFVVEKYPLSDNLYRVSHFNFSPSNYKVSKYNINNILKDKESIYKLNIDDSSNIIFEYKSPTSSRLDSTSNALIFNSNSRIWTTNNTLLRSSYVPEANEYYSHVQLNIQDDIFEYCYSIDYKI